MPNRNNISSTLLQLRQARGLTQEKAAHMVGVTGLTWGNWERGHHSPSDNRRLQIAKAFDVDPIDLGYIGRDIDRDALIRLINEQAETIGALREDFGELKETLGELREFVKQCCEPGN